MSRPQHSSGRGRGFTTSCGALAYTGSSDDIRKKVAAERKKAVAEDSADGDAKSSGYLGQLTRSELDKAQRFCAVGALMRATSEFTSDSLAAEILAYQTQLALLDFAGVPEGQTTLERINDHQGHRAVLVIFDEFLGKR